MTEERSRGVMLYAFAAIVLLLGGVWFVRSAPDTSDDPRLAGWRETAERLLPETARGIGAESIVLAVDGQAERTTPVTGGSYALSVICAGTGHVRVRLSTTGTDSGRAVACSDEPSPLVLRVALATEFYLKVSAETDGGSAVFRWRLERARNY